MSLTTTRLLDNYIAGRWTPATAATDVLDVINPATGEALARVPLSGPRISTRRSARRGRRCRSGGRCRRSPAPGSCSTCASG